MPRRLVRATRDVVSIRLLLVASALILVHGCAENTVTPSLNLPDPPPDPVPAWLEANAHPFDGSHLSLPHTDIEFFRDIVGDARIVALGENTHGTREFFEMKARILRFLVEEMDFNTFAMEATWPESRRLDHYVRTGEGDPAVLLSGLYFWISRTESVLEMIEWMRDHNEAGGNIGFHGFDMQFPGMALHNVREYVRDVDPASSSVVAEQLDCLTRFANDHARNWPDSIYEDQPEAFQSDCAARLQEVGDRLQANRDRYEDVAGKDAFEVALQSLRVAVQYHLKTAEDGNRDEFMAENTEWINRRIGTEGRMVLWAHNYHVSAEPENQGSFLRETFGDEMVIIGFSHVDGWFTARHVTGSRPLGLHQLHPVVDGSYESYLSRGSLPWFVLDLRNRDDNSLGGLWLRGTRPFRFIGCCYFPSRPEIFWRPTPLTEWYDVLIHFQTTRATTLLPLRYPDSW